MIYSSLLQTNRLLVFYFTRCLLAFVCAGCETYFYRGVQRVFGPSIARLWLIFSILATGMFVASTAFLPSTFSMYWVLVSYGAWYQVRIIVIASKLMRILIATSSNHDRRIIGFGVDRLAFLRDRISPDSRGHVRAEEAAIILHKVVGNLSELDWNTTHSRRLVALREAGHCAHQHRIVQRIQLFGCESVWGRTVDILLRKRTPQLQCALRG